MRKTYLLAVMALLAVALLVSGCIDTEYTIGLNADGTETIKVNIKAPSGMDATKLQEMQDDLTSKGYTVEKTTDKDSNIIITANKTAAAGKWELPYNAKVVSADPKFTQNYSNLFVHKSWEFTASYEFDQKKVNELVGKPEESTTDATATDDSGVNMEDYSLDFIYHITIPGTVSEQNAASFVDNKDGTATYTWSYNTDKDKGVDIKRKSSETNTMAIAIGAGVLLLLILIPIVLKVTRKDKSGPSYQPSSGFDSPDQNA